MNTGKVACLADSLAIRELLEKAGWSHVEVMTEW